MMFILISLSPEVPQICRFPSEVGPCRGMLKRYFFNMTSMQCEIFYYGGCLGNSNRFGDLASCEEYCSPKKCERRPSLTSPFIAGSVLTRVLFLCPHSSARPLSGPSGQREVLGIHPSLLLQRGHQEVRGVRLLGLRREQQQFCVEAELQGCVCDRCVRRGEGRNRSSGFIVRLAKKKGPEKLKKKKLEPSSASEEDVAMESSPTLLSCR